MVCCPYGELFYKQTTRSAIPAHSKLEEGPAAKSCNVIIFYAFLNMNHHPLKAGNFSIHAFSDSRLPYGPGVLFASKTPNILDIKMWLDGDQ